MVEVLVSGAGIAGSTLAYWLSRYGFEVTVVERAAGSRSSGNPVDVRGPALEVVTAMGVLPELRAAATDVDRLRFVDARGRRRASMRVGDRDRGEVELARADLATILAAASGDRVRMRWGDVFPRSSSPARGLPSASNRGSERTTTTCSAPTDCIRRFGG